MNEAGFLVDGNPDGCLGCEACVQVCPKSALEMDTDKEGFRYPILDVTKCIDCGLCHKVCPVEKLPVKNNRAERVFGGYIKDETIRNQSTSGGAFSAIVDSWCKEKYVIFGAVADGLSVHHSYILDKALLSSFRRSKYTQSIIGDSYCDARRFLKDGYNVLFSGTPCQIAGLIKYLKETRTDCSRLLTVEVVCEGVPSPLYVQKLDDKMKQRYGSRISSMDYRYKSPRRWDYEIMGIHLKSSAKWDFQSMSFFLGGGIFLKKDRWFNPFWSVWLDHLISRPSCYECPFTTAERVADITLGDLWGVHIYCPDLYGDNGGASVIFANSDKGRIALQLCQSLMFGHDLKIEEALRFQGPMRKSIPMNPKRTECMQDLENPDITYDQFNKKWAKRPSLGLLFRKYVWGNHQKVNWGKFKNKILGK